MIERITPFIAATYASVRPKSVVKVMMRPAGTGIGYHAGGPPPIHSRTHGDDVIKGRLVDLRAVEPADIPLLARWLNDPEVMEFWGRPGNTVSVSEVEAHERAEAARASSRKYMIQAKSGEA